MVGLCRQEPKGRHGRISHPWVPRALQRHPGNGAEVGREEETVWEKRNKPAAATGIAQIMTLAKPWKSWCSLQAIQAQFLPRILFLHDDTLGGSAATACQRPDGPDNQAQGSEVLPPTRCMPEQERPRCAGRRSQSRADQPGGVPAPEEGDPGAVTGLLNFCDGPAKNDSGVLVSAASISWRRRGIYWCSG